MKILHIGPVYPTNSTSGVHQSIRGWAFAQVKIGLQVGVLSSLAVPEGELREQWPGVTLLHGFQKKHYNPWLVSGDWMVRIQVEFGTPDVIHFHTINSPFQSALARRCRESNWPYIITPHGEATRLAQSTNRIKKTIVNFLAFRSYVKHAAAIHALNPREAEQIQDLFDVKQIIIVSNGVDESLFDMCNQLEPANLRSFAAQDGLLLGFVGRLDIHIKGLDLLFKALAKLKSTPGGPKVKLFIIGNFQTKKDRVWILSAIKSLKLDDVVKIVGPKFGNEKWSYFLACDVFVHTSRTEGIPMAVLEAMALARPCLVTPQTNMADVVAQAGGWVTNTDSDEIADTLLKIYDQRDLLSDIGQRSRDVVCERLSWTKLAEQMKTEYAKICDINT